MQHHVFRSSLSGATSGSAGFGNRGLAQSPRISTIRRATVASWVLACAMASGASAGVVPVTPDVNRDGIVNAIDVAMVAQCLGRHSHKVECATADVDHDGDVDVTDLQIVVRFLRPRQPVPTATPTEIRMPATATATAIPTAEFVPTATTTPPPTDTPSPTAIPTATPASTTAPTVTSTATPPATATATDTATQLPTASDTATGSATFTAASTVTPTNTHTPTPTQTNMPTDTPTSTATATVPQTASPSFTSTGSPTATFTPIHTATSTNPPPPPSTPTAISTLTHTPAPSTPINTSTQTAMSTVDAGLPPDPADVAPPLDQSVVTTLQAATEFLYTGTNPVQTGVVAGIIDPKRVAVLRGKVIDRSDAPLPGVQITILNHPEFGQTLTRADGMFDLAVNGGGLLTVQYDRAGLLRAQRQVNTPWRDYAMLPDVVLIALDPQMTTVELTANVPVQVARGSVMSDGDGTRQATVLVPQGTTAMMVLPGGATQSLTTLSIRATEYTVGANGPQAMPAELPPTSGYTYALELSADEALAAGATEVRFNSPLPFYVENFLDFPAGTTVPLGGYDRTRGVWVPANSGQVVTIVSVTGGFADLDLNGDGLADGNAALAAFSITDAERQQLAALYLAGQSLWRVLIPHFSSWDCNWGFGPPVDAVAPTDDVERAEDLDGSCTETGSIIECQNQILGEVVDVRGTPFRLHYESDRVPGYTVANHLDIPLSGAQLPTSLRRIDLEIQVAGRIHRQTFAALPNQRTTFVWDGTDAYGRSIQGLQPITVGVGYTYDGVYMNTRRFGYNGNGTAITGNRARRELTLWHVWRGKVGTWDALADGLGGWTLNAHHGYDPREGLLHRGDGVHPNARSLGPTIRTVAGTGLFCSARGNPCGDGGLATQAQITPKGLAFGPDGSFYIADADRVRRVGPDGIIRNVAGTGFLCATAPCGDGGPATQAFVSPYGLAVGPDGSIYIGEANSRIRKVTPDGIIRTIAGTGVPGYSGDDGPANLAQLSAPLSLALGPDGSLYIADQQNFRIRRIGPDGIITTVAGIGPGASCLGSVGDGGPATLARLCSPQGVAVGQDGSIYIADTANNRIRRVTPDGIIQTIAGSATQGFAGDGGPATQALFRLPSVVAVGGDGSVYVADAGNNRVRWFRPGGVINTLAGTGVQGTSGDGGLASRAAVEHLEFGLAVRADGRVYFAQSFENDRVREVVPIAPQVAAGEFAVPSEDAAEVYVFNESGRHLRTLDALTGGLRDEFTYDSGGRLATIADGDGNVTTIAHDAAGQPTAIVGPFGQRTTLTTNGDGYLDRITDPIGAALQFSYTADGLLTDLTNARGHVTQYDYDADGRLTSTTDPTNATKTFARAGTNRDYTVTLTRPLGRTTTYRVETLPTGNIRSTNTSLATGQVQSAIGTDGTETTTFADGTTVNMVLGPDPRWGMLAPVVTSMTVRTPGGRVHTRTRQRTATLANPTDILSLTAFTETVTINGRAFTTAYDAASRTLTVTAPSGRRATSIVDAHGRPVQLQFGNLALRSFSYDLQGRLASATLGSGAGSRTKTLAYGVNGFLQSVTDAASRTSTFVRDANGRTTDLTSPDGGLAHFTYDANGNITNLTPPGRPDHTFAFTQNNQVSSYTAPMVNAENSQTLATYNADRQPLRVDRPDGQSGAVQYDSGGRPSLIDIAVGDLLYSYDSAGRLATLSRDQGADLAYAYDGGLPIVTTWNGAIVGNVTRAYDNDFREASLSVNGTTPIALTYDLDGLLIQAGALTLTRNALNGLIISTAFGTVTDTTTYDVFGAPATYTASHNGSAIYSTTYTQDALGRIVSKSETIGGIAHTFAYTYDPAGRLTEVRQDNVLTASYSYDSNGNRLSRSAGGSTITATYDTQDRLGQFGTTTYVHNAAGERQSKSAAGPTINYQYDTLGNLTGVTLPGATQIEYLLDGAARRVGKKLNGTLVQGFLYQDGLKPIAELDGSNTVVSRFVYAVGLNVPAYMIKAGVTYRIVTDHLGSPRLVIDASTGSVAQRLDYDEFGNVILDTNPGFQPFGFAGGIYDSDTQLVRFGARHYDAETGRWITKDPIAFGGGANLYAYAANNPVNLVDPLGNAPVDPLASTGAAPPPLSTTNLTSGAHSVAAAPAEFPRFWAVPEGDYRILEAHYRGSMTFRGNGPMGTNQVFGTIGGGGQLTLEKCRAATPPLQPLPQLTIAGGIRAGLYGLAAAGIEFLAVAEPIGWVVLTADLASGGRVLAPLPIEEWLSVHDGSFFW